MPPKPVGLAEVMKGNLPALSIIFRGPFSLLVTKWCSAMQTISASWGGELVLCKRQSIALSDQLVMLAN